MIKEELDALATEVSAALAGQIDMAPVAGQVPAAVKDYLDGQAMKSEDPFRTSIHFLAGLTTACVALIVGIFAALSKNTAAVAAQMMGGALAWISATALLAVICIAWLQVWKSRYRKRIIVDGNPVAGSQPNAIGLWMLMHVPVLPSLGAVAYALRGGAALMAKQTALPGFTDAILSLF